MTSLTRDIPEQGQLVRVRQRLYVVSDVAQNMLPPDIYKKGSFTQAPSTHHVVTMTSVEDDALGEKLEVVWEIEPGAEVIGKAELPPLTGFDSPARLDAFLNAVRWGASSSADVSAIQAPFRSGIEIEDYQLAPVARAIQMPRVNLLIADDVGLGKTIEAGLVMQELIIRNRARKVLIVCPASLQIQWHDQMRDKFGLEFHIVDSTMMRLLRRERGLHVNPWTHFPRLITSIDYLKNDRMLRLFGEALPAEGESPYPRRFDLLIVDEAHNVAPSGQVKYATDSRRTKAIRRLAPHFEHKLFLSATPHNGFQVSFTALLELLDNQRFARGIPPDQIQLHRIMVRRLKSEFKDFAGGNLFPKRELATLDVVYSPEEKRVHSLLQKYTLSRLKGAVDEIERYATEFTMKLLKKRLLSSPQAFAMTLEKHESSLASARKHNRISSRPRPGILRSQLEQVEDDVDDDDMLEEATHNALSIVAPLFRPPSPEEEEMLRQMRDWAEVARERLDQKAKRLCDWLNENIRPGGKWSNERVIIFTEYRATQNWLIDRFSSEGFVANNRLRCLYGGMTSEEREEIKAAFQADPVDSPVRILLATDAASEGIDLQNFCSKLIHYEIPWNPNRMEQRNGRIDRHGQNASQVTIFHFAPSNYRDFVNEDLPVGELEADLEFLMRAVRKVEAIREDLGKVGPVIATQVEEAMIGKRHRLNTLVAEQAAAPISKLLKMEAEMAKDVERLHDQLQKSRRDLNLTPQNIQAVVETALDLAGQLPLRPARLLDPHGKLPPLDVFYLPALQGSWAACTNGLDHPFTRQQRPIVFDHDLMKGRDDVVLAHLNHRLVVMSLRLLRAKVWTSDATRKLHRVTARIVSGDTFSTPAVVAHARLLIIGSDSQRLHEELIEAGGFIRQGHFSRMTQNEIKTMMSAATTEQARGSIENTLLDLWSKLEEPLYRSLEVEMKDPQTSLQKLLNKRLIQEQSDIEAVLSELKRSIEAEMKPWLGAHQLILDGFNTSEREQFERNVSALQLRLAQIPGEIAEEKAALQRRFAEPQARLFPVAVTFLVPRKFVR